MLRKKFVFSFLLMLVLSLTELFSQQAQQDPKADKEIVGLVNDQEITRQELIAELLNRYEKKHLEVMIDRLVIQHEATRLGIEITEKDIQKELLIQQGAFSPEQFEKESLRPKGLTLAIFKADTFVPFLLLEKIAERRVTVTDKEIEAVFEQRFGERVLCRLIVCQDMRDAKKTADQIGNSREKYISVEESRPSPVSGYTSGGLPIGHTQNPDNIEKRAFELKDGEISEIIPTEAGRGVILLREKLLPSNKGDVNKEEVSKFIRKKIIDERTREMVKTMQSSLRDRNLATIIPGVQGSDIACLVNGVPIKRAEIGEELFTRKGKKQLEYMLFRKMVEMEAKLAKANVTDEDVKIELQRMMKAQNCRTQKEYEQQFLAPRGLSLTEYEHDVLKPRMLLQAIAKEKLSLTEADLKKRFNSKFGEKVECRIIAFKDARQATAAHSYIGGQRSRFIELARSQSDPQLRATAGLINEIERFSTNDVIEKKAFAMQDGDIHSEVLHTPEGDFVILMRERLIHADYRAKFEDYKEILQAEAQEKLCVENVPAIVEELKKKYKIKNYLTPNRIDIKELKEGLEAASQRPIN